jgi:hypothetical protein
VPSSLFADENASVSDTFSSTGNFAPQLHRHRPPSGSTRPFRSATRSSPTLRALHHLLRQRRNESGDITRLSRWQLQQRSARRPAQQPRSPARHAADQPPSGKWLADAVIDAGTPMSTKLPAAMPLQRRSIPRTVHHSLFPRLRQSRVPRQREQHRGVAPLHSGRSPM